MKHYLFYLALLSVLPLAGQNIIPRLELGTPTEEKMPVQKIAGSHELQEVLNHVGKSVVGIVSRFNDRSGEQLSWRSDVQLTSKTPHRFSAWISLKDLPKSQLNFKASSSKLQSDNAASSVMDWSLDSAESRENWMLWVGFIVPADRINDTLVNGGGVYSGITGERLRTLPNYRLSSNTNNNQVALELQITKQSDLPGQIAVHSLRMDVVNADMPSLNELLLRGPTPVLTFTYDSAGNQLDRTYCSGALSCTFPSPGKLAEDLGEAPLGATESLPEETILENRIGVYPNPTSGEVTLAWDTYVGELVQQVRITGYHSPFERLVPVDPLHKHATVDLSNEAPSIFFAEFHLSDGRKVFKKIIKH